MVGGKQGWVTGRGGRRRVGQDWEAKCRRPNNGQAASTDLPIPPEALVRSVNLFPFCSANIGPSICPGCAMHCPLRVIHTRLRHLSHRYSSRPRLLPPLTPFPFSVSALLVVRLTLREGRRERERIKGTLDFFFPASFPRYSFLSLWRDRYVFEFSNFFERYVVDGRVTIDEVLGEEFNIR